MWSISLTNKGQVQARYQYDAWGNKRQEQGESYNRFSFTGYEEDKETGLLYAKARFYDPDTGKFLSEDAWEGDNMIAPSLHRYLYAYQNPTVWVDPTGNVNLYFGGTTNHLIKDRNYLGDIVQHELTLVEELFLADEGVKFYVPGIGSGFHPDGTPYERGSNLLINIEIATGKTMDERVSFMMEVLEQQLRLGDNELNLMGFSRGAASGVETLNRIQDEIDSGNPLYQDLVINSVVLIDAVSSKRTGLLMESNSNLTNRKVDRRGRVLSSKPDYRFNLPQEMKFRHKPLHLVSIDERREQFQPLDLKGAKQLGFRGVHSDLAGSYPGQPFEFPVIDFILNATDEFGISYSHEALKEYYGPIMNGYQHWLSSGKISSAQTNVPPTDNSGNIWINDNEDRHFPKGLELHESVDYFSAPPLNDISKYEYQLDK